jgi:hypothetical protein
MATQTIEFRSPPSQTVTLRLFVQGSDTQVASASATEATNRKGTYTAAFTDVAAGEYQLIATIGTSPIIPVASGFVTLTLTTATFYAYAKVELITKPPTAAAIADTTLSSLTSGPSIGGNWPNESFGRRVLVGSSTQREVAVTGSNHVAADVHEFQPDAIDSDAIATSAVTEIAGGVWSAASSAYSAATGTMGLIMYAFSQMLELVTGVWRWKATSLSQAPAGGGNNVVNVLPAVGISAERQAGVVLSPFVGETISQSITLYATDGTTPINLSGKSLEIVFQTRSGTDVAVIANANITISGTSNNIVTFAYPSAVTTTERTLRVSLRDNAAPRTVYLSGLCKVSIAPSVDA